MGSDTITQGADGTTTGIREGIIKPGTNVPDAVGGTSTGFLQGAENVGREGVASLSELVQGGRKDLVNLGANPADIFTKKGAKEAAKALAPTATLGSGDVAYEAAIDAQDAYERADLEEQRQMEETTTADEEERATLQMTFMRQAGIPETEVKTTLEMNDLGDYYEPPVEAAAQGGIIGLKEGGMLNFGGREMDLRTGGFVPMGRKERADDVPARLSKNEFVMTADAVRAAGGGSVNEGAKRMYEVMNNLEARA